MEETQIRKNFISHIRGKKLTPTQKKKLKASEMIGGLINDIERGIMDTHQTLELLRAIKEILELQV